MVDTNFFGTRVINGQEITGSMPFRTAYPFYNWVGHAALSALGHAAVSRFANYASGYKNYNTIPEELANRFSGSVLRGGMNLIWRPRAPRTRRLGLLLRRYFKGAGSRNRRSRRSRLFGRRRYS